MLASGSLLVHPSAQAGPPNAGCPGLASPVPAGTATCSSALQHREPPAPAASSSHRSDAHRTVGRVRSPANVMK